MLGVVLIKTGQERGTHQVTEKIAREAAKIPGVTDSYSVLGRYDNVVFIEGNNFVALRKISRKVASLKGVKNSETLCESD